MAVVQYNSSLKSEWNTFVEKSKNGTFLIDRNYMDYHANRFVDLSLMIFDDKKNLRSVFPANVKDESTVVSHSGLTYGSVLLPAQIKLEEVLAVFQQIMTFYKNKGFKKIIYKAIPHFYYKEPAFEEQYILFLLGAKISRMDTGFVNLLDENPNLQERKRRNIKKAQKAGIEIIQTPNFRPFWDEVLSPNLLSRFGVLPVHSLEEIELLARNFSDNILQFNALQDGKIVAGTTIFKNGDVAHAQYISAGERGKETGAMDFLFYHLITERFRGLKYFSFGIANENEGTEINKGLMEWKEGFGSKLFPNIFYEINLELFEPESSDLLLKLKNRFS